jgi:hypothetical protein
MVPMYVNYARNDLTGQSRRKLRRVAEPNREDICSI